MSAGAALRLTDARAVALDLVAKIADACERIEIAGSIRRRRGEVHDIELVAISRIASSSASDLWGEVETTNWYALDELVSSMCVTGDLAPRAVEIHRKDGSVETGTRMGGAYKALVFRGMPVDLFITDAERWGCIFALRTGPGDWNQRLVTDCRAHFRQVEGGRVWYAGKPIPTPEEADFFRALGVPWLDPWERRTERLRFDRELLGSVAT